LHTPEARPGYAARNPTEIGPASIRVPSLDTTTTVGGLMKYAHHRVTNRISGRLSNPIHRPPILLTVKLRDYLANGVSGGFH
jgi:hypothetical protein